MLDNAPMFFKEVMEKMGVEPKPYVDAILAIINGEKPDNSNYDRLHEAFLVSQKLNGGVWSSLGRMYCEDLLERISPVPEWGIDVLLSRARCTIEWYHRHFEGTKNPLYALKAYSKAREIGDLPPEWVLAYLDDGINAFLAAYNRRDAQSKIADAFAKCFRISKAMIRSYRKSRDPRFGSCAIDIARKRARAGLPINESAVIFEAAAELDKKMSDAGIWRAWRLYKRTHPRAAEIIGEWRERSDRRRRLSKNPRIFDTNASGDS